MTNGEKMKADFPDIEMWGESKDTLDYSLGGMVHRVTKKWWYAEYKEPTTKNNLGVDCISRVDVNQVIEDYMDEQYHVLSDRTRERAFGAKAVKARINELQPVTSIRPKGHWIDKFGGVYRCSYCREVISIDTAEFPNGIRYKYCPFCGSKNSVKIEKEGDKE